MSADILDFAVWRACLRAETQPAPEPALSPKLARAIKLAEIARDAACRAACRYNRLGRHAEALTKLHECRTDILALAQTYPHMQMTWLLQDLSGKAQQVRRQIKASAKR